MRLGRVEKFLYTSEEYERLIDRSEQETRTWGTEFNYRPEDIFPCTEAIKTSLSLPKITVFAEGHNDRGATELRQKLFQEVQNQSPFSAVSLGLEAERPMDATSLRKRLSDSKGLPLGSTAIFGLEYEEGPQVLSLLRGWSEKAGELEFALNGGVVYSPYGMPSRVKPLDKTEVDRRFGVFVQGFVQEISKYPSFRKALLSLKKELSKESESNSESPTLFPRKEFSEFLDRILQAVDLSVTLPNRTNLALNLFPTEQGLAFAKVLSTVVAQREAGRIGEYINAGIMKGPLNFKSHRYVSLLKGPSMRDFWDVDILWRNYSFAQAIGRRVCSQLGRVEDIKVVVGFDHAYHLAKILQNFSNSRLIVEIKDPTSGSSPFAPSSSRSLR